MTGSSKKNMTTHRCSLMQPLVNPLVVLTIGAKGSIHTHLRNTSESTKYPTPHHEINEKETPHIYQIPNLYRPHLKKTNILSNFQH